MKLIANSNMTLQQTDPLVVCVISPTGSPSLKVKAEGSGVIEDGFQVSVSAIQVPSAGATIPDAGPYNVTISSTATKVKADSTFVCLLNDKTGVINATPQIPGTPPTPYPVSFQIEIVDAGQTKVNGI